MRHPLSRDVLMTPGPVEERLEDRLAGLAMRHHHRTAQFEAVYLRVAKSLADLVGTSGNLALLASSGSGGLEAAFTNFVDPEGGVVVVAAGKFGERWKLIAEAHGLNPVVVRKEPGRAASVEELLQAVEASGARTVCTTLQETSTGVLHDIQAFGEALESCGCLLLVDAVSGLGAVPYKMDAWKVDVTIAGSQKGLLTAPGVGLVAWSGRAEDRRQKPGLNRFYFDLGKYVKNPSRAPFTPPTTLIAQLDSVLKSLEEVGLERVLKSVQAASEACLAGAEALGLEPLSPPPERSPGLTTLKLPEDVDGAKIPKAIQAKVGIKVAGGQDSLKGKIIRIGHMGATTPGDLLGTFLGLEAALLEEGYAFEPGAGVQAVAKALLQSS